MAAIDVELETMVPIHVAEEIEVPIQERVRTTTERLEADFSNIETKIHRFPQGLREIGDHYIVPRFVALGPYHHGLPHLQEVEEVKYVAAHYFCTKSGHSVEQVYDQVFSVVGEARGCYVDEAAVARFNDVEFAEMMFLDGCFLLQYIGYGLNHPPLLENRIVLSTGPCILRDIFLLENQLPWLVLQALMTFTSVHVFDFIVDRASHFDVSSISTKRIEQRDFDRYNPPHLLGLLRYYQIGSMPSKDESIDFTYCALPSSAIQLAEIGVKLTASNKSWFADMTIQQGLFAYELSLTPLFLNGYTTCWLVNMVAFEACMSTNALNDGYVVCSYLSFLAMLMDKEEDVHELRAKHLLQSFFNDKEILHFFNNLTHHVRLGNRYHAILDRIDEFKRHRPVRIVVHKFLCKNYKTIFTLLSIAGVLAGFFKTLIFMTLAIFT